MWPSLQGYRTGLHHSERASGQEAVVGLAQLDVTFVLWDQAWLVLVLFLSATAAALAARWYFQASQIMQPNHAALHFARVGRLGLPLQACRKGRCAARGMELRCCGSAVQKRCPADSREDPLLLELQSLEEGLRDVQPPEFVRPGLEPPVSLPSEPGPPATSPTELSLPNRGLALSVSLPTEPGSTASVPILTQPTSLVSSPTHPGSPVSLPPEPASQGTAPPSAAMLCSQRPSVLHHDDEEWRPDGGDPESEPWVEEEEPQVELWLEAKELQDDAFHAACVRMKPLKLLRFFGQLSQEWKSICRFARVYEERLHHAKERGVA
ncbi:unnamed protein product [Symbiodinium sp. CCMP2592]|nr:unnamed protein product [Symbiodinium sp. CCMP2592]